MKAHIQTELNTIATNIANASVRLVDVQTELKEIEAYLREQKTAHSALVKIQRTMQQEEKTNEPD